ncbi:hypothetical protein AB0D10_43005 [Kitasatospora sp. NPDC048545]|uniref:hypothetical protein n=1 Tax=Kitasatospora sp. NPDC048545 TaxID=3157208 RepID=UPI0033C2842F
MNDPLRDLQQMSAFLGELTNSLAVTRDILPQRSEGADRTGSVTVVLDQEDLPLSIVVADGWRQRLSPGALGGAAVEAGQAAAVDRLSIWQQDAGQAAWEAVPDRLPGDDAAADAGATTAPDLTLLIGDVSQVDPRPLEVLAEDVLTALDRAGAPSVPVQGRGSDEAGHVTVVLSRGGLVTCDADERWAAASGTAALNHALAAALSKARTELAAAVRSAKEEAGTGTDAMLREALALLADPGKLRNS